MHQTILRHIRGILSGYAVHIFLVLVDLVHLALGNIQIQSSQIINHFYDSCPVHTHIFLDIQIQIGI